MLKTCDSLEGMGAARTADKALNNRWEKLAWILLNYLSMFCQKHAFKYLNNGILAKIDAPVHTFWDALGDFI